MQQRCVFFCLKSVPKYCLILNSKPIRRRLYIWYNLPYHCYNGEEELHFHRAMFCDPNLNLFPEIFPIEANLFM